MSTSTPAFVPPFFKNFGKQSKDLFKKKYDFEHTVKTINKGSRNVTLESGVVAPKGGDLRGYVKADVKRDFGVINTELHTDANSESKAAFKFTTLAKGLNLTVTGSSKDKDKSFKRGAFIADVEYAQDYFASTLQAKSDFDVNKAEGSVAVGVEGLSVGGQASVDITNGAQLTDSNFGVEYVKDNYVVSLFTESNRNVLNASYVLDIVPRRQQVSAALKYDLVKQSRNWSLGTFYQVDNFTTARGKAELSSTTPSFTTVSTAVEHTLANPNLLLGIAAQFKVSKAAVDATELGVSVTLGDF